MRGGCDDSEYHRLLTDAGFKGPAERIIEAVICGFFGGLLGFFVVPVGMAFFGKEAYLGGFWHWLLWIMTVVVSVASTLQSSAAANVKAQALARQALGPRQRV